MAIEGPSEAKMSCKDNKDGSCSVEYIPFTPGEYDVNITFGGLPIPGGIFPLQDRQIKVSFSKLSFVIILVFFYINPRAG